MSQHIGIVACSAEGAALCYRTICLEGPALLGPHRHPEVSMHTHALADYVICLDRGDLAGVADLMLSSAAKLAAAGADFLICPDNTIHAAMPLVTGRTPRPWLHIADVAVAEAAARGYRRIGITGTKWLVESDVYPTALQAYGLDYVRPSMPEREEISRIIMDELVCGIIDRASTDYVLGVIEHLKEQRCDAVVLGCTELPLVVNDANAALPTLDSTRLLARAALKRSLGADASRQGSGS